MSFQTINAIYDRRRRKNDVFDINNMADANVVQSTSESLYSKLLDVGLNDTMIGKAIKHIHRPERLAPNAHVIKEGYLTKQSIHLKKLRQRWMVLKGKYLYSYKERQVYEDPTETFDLKLYRTVKMVDNSGIAGQFELIALKQERRRTFIAATQEEMQEWIKYIKKVILFSKEYSDKCRSLRSCLSLRRLTNVLRLHKCYSQYNDTCLRYIASYKQLINDYHHVLRSHLNECSGSGDAYEVIQKLMNFHCNIDQCACYKRNHRIREYDEPLANKHLLIVYRDLLDTIHCTLIHAFDSGLNVKHKYLESIKSVKHPHHLKSNQCFDPYLMELKRHLSQHKKRFLKERKQNDRVRNCNKFYRKTLGEKPLPPLMLDPSELDSNTIASHYCEFGQKFVYWDHCRSSPFYICKKYDTLKLEIMDNIFCPLEISKYIQTHIKSALWLRNSDVIRKMSSDGHNPYRIDADTTLSLEHLMALIFYTDFGILSSHFVSTYHPLSRMESRHAVMTRHREFCGWSRLLNEAVQCFGCNVNGSRITSYYVCTPSQHFDRFLLRFHQPTSMTTNLSIATLFCPSNGIILEVKKRRRRVGGEGLRYFDCSFVSSFSGEREVLFIGGSQSLQLSSIRCMHTNACYQRFIAPFIAFMKIVNDTDILKILWHEDYLIISNLISSKTIHQKSMCPRYIVQCFDAFCGEQKVIKMNLKSLYNFSHNFIHLECGNLLLFDNLCILFNNCEVIHCIATGSIDALYLSLLSAILQHINTNKHQKLNQIILHGITEVKVSDQEFEKYKRVLREKVQWMAETTSTTTLTLCRCEYES